MNEIIKSLYNRKSMRVYEEKSIPQEMKKVILEAAAQAPTAGCQQLYTILDITDEELKILDCLVKEKSYEEISSYIRCSIATVGRKISVIKEKVEGSDLNMKNRVPIWEKMNLTLEEAAEYSNIGVNKLREISNSPKCPFVIYIGRKRLIRRKEFEKYIGNQIEI